MRFGWSETYTFEATFKGMEAADKMCKFLEAKGIGIAERKVSTTCVIIQTMPTHFEVEDWMVKNDD